MNGACCSQRTGRWIQAAGTALPGALAILLPKCPLCIAAWLTASTGVALPAPVAGDVRPLLAILCALSVGLLIHRARRESAAHGD